MKNYVIYALGLIFGAYLVFLTGCPHNKTQFEELATNYNARKRDRSVINSANNCIRTMVYIRDVTTDLCFMYCGSYQESTTAFVPCALVQDKLINGGLAVTMVFLLLAFICFMSNQPFIGLALLWYVLFFSSK